jgi:hypothetical protein
VREPRGRGTSAVGSRYRATVSGEDAVSNSPINSIINPKSVDSHTQSRDNINHSDSLKNEPCQLKLRIYVSAGL